MIQYHITLFSGKAERGHHWSLFSLIILSQQSNEERSWINVQHVDRLQLIINLQFTHDLNWTAGLMEGLRGGAQVCGRLTGTWCFAGWRRRVWCRFLPRSERRVRRQRSAVSESRTARLRNTVTWQTFNKKLRLKRAIPDKLRLCQLKVNGFTHSVRGVPQGSTLGPM